MVSGSTGGASGQPDKIRQTDQPRLYTELASWWHLLSKPDDYEEEAALYRDAIRTSAVRSVRTVLELGSGGGNNASHLKRDFRMTLVDPSPGMLAASRSLNPDCEHFEGDMRTCRLERTFDAVFIHDAIAYMTTEADLRRAIETAFVHLEPGGAAVFVPDHTRESFRPWTSRGGHDGEGRAMRYLEWATDPEPADTTYFVDFTFMLREGSDLRHEHDRHVCGLFGRDEWLRFIAEAGFEAILVPVEGADGEGMPFQLFVGSKGVRGVEPGPG